MAVMPPTKSCLNCPSYLNPTEAAASSGKSIDAPMCASFGYVLGRTGATIKQNNDTAAIRASNCSKYGDAKPFRDLRALAKVCTEVAMPDPDAMNQLDDLDANRTTVRSCAQCAKFIGESPVHAATGWAAGMCAARGRLIPSNKKVQEATSCGYRHSGANRKEMTLTLLPLFTSVEMAEKVKLEKLGQDTVDPLEWISDKPVTDEERNQGIKAWRMIVDPEGTGNVAYLPIFTPDIFSDAERSLIPKTGDDEHPELFVDYAGYIYQISILWMELDETPAAWGMPGVGKTEAARHLAWLMQLPFYRFSIKESTELYELEGSTQFKEGEGTFFKDGRFTTAWGSKCVIVVDEPNMGRTEVWAFLRPCTDGSKMLIIDADGGRNVPRNPFCFPMLAMNPAWSSLNIGTAPIGAADASRLFHIEFVLPDEAVERQIIKNRVALDGWAVDAKRLDLIIAVSTRIREMCEEGSLSMSWGLRETIKVTRALRFFDPITAFGISAANYLEPNQRESLLDQVRAALPATALPPVELIAKVS